MWMLLHGFTGAPGSWDAVVERAGLRQEPIRPWLTGHGPGWRDRCSSSFDAEVARLVEVAAAIDPPRRLAGYSLGARVALGVLIARPDLFDSAVLIGVHPGLEEEAERAERRGVDAGRARMLREHGIVAFVDAWEREPLFASQASVHASALAKQRAIRTGHEAEGLARSLEVLGLGVMPSHWSRLDRVRCEVTSIVGGRDAKFVSIADRLRAAHDRIHGARVDGAGHNLLLEAPDAVANALRKVDTGAQREPA